MKNSILAIILFLGVAVGTNSHGQQRNTVAPQSATLGTNGVWICPPGTTLVTTPVYYTHWELQTQTVQRRVCTLVGRFGFCRQWEIRNVDVQTWVPVTTLVGVNQCLPILFFPRF